MCIKICSDGYIIIIISGLVNSYRYGVFGINRLVYRFKVLVLQFNAQFSCYLFLKIYCEGNGGRHGSLCHG